ncbi:AAA family ATPase [Dyadobacter sp. CY356]|uniref:AAA family ATPase n=1 Tax=Dyadobacter sp. CY356 TaxID=2906442 RepID=UPI001F3778F3|nr:AAA family ATPase [Dyadobacter sp. CY356]MCF0058226.1 ATP-binding protein [Dyadobacter sp. CY356]
MQRIEVKNFGPLKDINLEIKDYMVFIGPQASGKSTLAKLIYFFWKVEDKFRQEILPTYIGNLLTKTHREEVNYAETFKGDIRKLISDFFPTIRNGNISYFYNNEYSISIDLTLYSLRGKEDIQLSSGFINEINEVDQKIKSSPSLTNLLRQQKIDLDDFIKILSNDILSNSTETVKTERVYIPAGRIILSILSNSFQLVESNSLDYFNESLIRFTNKVRKFLTSPDHNNLFGRDAIILPYRGEEDIFSLCNRLSFKILKGDFHIGDNGDGIMQYHNNSGYVIPLKHTSSGQQESSWLINVIQYILAESDANGYDIIIEEPEAHLFPDAQRDMTKLITLLSSPDSEKKTRIIVTTHSPYILATLNNSIKAFSTAQIENKAEEVEKILSKEFWIDPKNLFVGFMNKNEGEDNFGIQDIFDQESGLIDHEVLDKVSDDIIKQFDDLLDIQYSE